MKSFLKYPQISVIFVLMLVTAVSAELVKSKENTEIKSNPLVSFPLTIGQWNGESRAMEIGIADFLELSDYTIINYRRDEDVINFYAAYYSNLKEGAFPHSPKLCIPGGGWEIYDMQQIKVSNYDIRRVAIVKNEIKQIVYYWYQQGGKSLSDEYQLKWNTFLLSLTEGRTDTSLVRLVTVQKKGETESSADERLVAFLNEINPEIQKRLN